MSLLPLLIALSRAAESLVGSSLSVRSDGALCVSAACVPDGGVARPNATRGVRLWIQYDDAVDTTFRTLADTAYNTSSPLHVGEGVMRLCTPAIKHLLVTEWGACCLDDGTPTGACASMEPSVDPLPPLRKTPTHGGPRLTVHAGSRDPNNLSQLCVLAACEDSGSAAPTPLVPVRMWISCITTPGRPLEGTSDGVHNATVNGVGYLCTPAKVDLIPVGWGACCYGANTTRAACDVMRA